MENAVRPAPRAKRPPGSRRKRHQGMRTLATMPGPEARPAEAREGRGVDTSPLGPLRFEPILKRLIWGGRRLGDLLDKPLGPESNYAESWEISDHEGDVSRVASGPLAGVTLRDLVRERPDELLG